jgi:hypothetical protein
MTGALSRLAAAMPDDTLVYEMERSAVSGPERYRKFVERCAETAEAESVRGRALRWRDVTFQERARVGIELMRLTERALRSRPIPYRKPPLTCRITPTRHG